MVTSSRPATIREAIDLAFSLTRDAIRMGTLTPKGSTGKGSSSKVTEEKAIENSEKKGKFQGKRRDLDRRIGLSSK